MIRLFLLLALVWSTGAAQDGLPKSVKEIRQLYADTQEAIARMDEEEHLRAQMTTTVQRNMPGSGIRKETVTTFFEEYDDSVDGIEFNPDYRPFFVTRKYNVAARKFYEEYLFDAETGTPVFIFLQGDSMEGDGKKDETRYYFGPLGKLSESIKGERLLDEQEALDQAASLWQSLKAQLNQFRDLAH